MAATSLLFCLTASQAVYPQGLRPSSPSSKRPTVADSLRPSATKALGRNTVATARMGDATYYAVNVEFTNPAARRVIFSDDHTSRILGATVITVIDRFADVFVAGDEPWEALATKPGLVRLEYLASVVPPPPPLQPTRSGPSRELPEQIVRGGYKGLTGKGVNIAILDTGLDFRHPDFSTLDASGQPVSRLKFLWDTSLPYVPGRGNPSPVKYPNGVPIGTVFTSAQLTAELRSSQQTIPAQDMDSHGTACASVAAGNGRADDGPLGLHRNSVKGVAPDASLIGVRLGPAGEEFANAYLLNAIAEWLDKVSGTDPLVISGSFGGHWGTPHDGQAVQERELSQRFPLTKVGRAMVFAAGNDRDSGVHKRIQLSGQKTAIQWNAPEATSISIYFSGQDKYEIWPTEQTPISSSSLSWDLNPFTGQWHATVNIGAGLGTIALDNPSGAPGTADLYFASAHAGAFADPSPTNLIGNPGDTLNAITVGSYDWSDNYHKATGLVSIGNPCGTKIDVGGLSCYSSAGPNRAFGGKPEVTKPEIVAPGEWYESAAAKDGGQMVGWGAEVPDITGNYHLMNGTSAATPYTAGVIALIFQKRPTLTLGALRDLLNNNMSRQDLRPFATPPSGIWGYGKLDLPAIDRILAKL
jgi:subtilisin family serine protease